MMKTALAISNLKFILITVVFALVFIGCSGNIPVAPTDQSLSGLEKIDLVEQIRGDDLFEPAEDGWLGRRQVFVVNQMDVALMFEPVGAEGGELELILGDEKTVLSIPAGALNMQVEISALVVSYDIVGQGELTFYNFGPDGLVFNKAANLTLETNLAEGTTISLYWWNPDNSLWEVEQSATVDENGVVEFLINHFSKYAIS